MRKAKTPPSRPRARAFREIVDDLPAAVWESGPAPFQTVYVSQGAVRMLGYPALDWTTRPGFFSELVHPEDRDRLLREVQATVTAPGHYEFEYRMTAADGRVVWVRDYVHAIPDAQGNIERLRGVVIDVSERKLAEESTRQAEARAREMAERMRAVAAAAAAVIGTSNLDQLHGVLREACETVVALDAFTLALYDPRDRTLAYLAGFDGSLAVPATTVPVAGTPSERVIEERRSLVTLRSDDPAVAGASRWGTASRSESAIRTPVLVGGEVLGVLSVQSYSPDLYTQEDVRVLEAIAALAATAIRHLRDQDNQRSAEHSLRSSQERFRALIDHSSDLITVLGPGGIILFESPSLERVLGYRPEDLASRNILEFVHPDDVALVASALTRAQRQEEIAPLAFRARHRSGSWRVLEAVATNLLADPAIEGIVINSRDVTERTHVEDARRRLSAILEATTDFVGTTDAFGRLLYVNVAGRRMLGLSDGESVDSLSIADLHPPGEAAALLSRAVSLAVRDGVWSGETIFQGQGGHLIPVSQVIVAHKTPGGTVEFLSTIARDITDRRRAEEDLRQREQHYRGLFENAHDAILILDPETETILDVNQRACDLYGRAREELVGGPWKTVASDAFQELLQLGGPAGLEITPQFESFQYRKDGSQIQVEVHANVIDFRGRRALLTINRDITERRQLEAQFRQAQKMEAVGRLAGGVAHDFNNLLTAIKGHTFIMLDDLEPAAPVRFSVEEIDKAADRAAALTRQLLAFSRRQVLQPKVMDLNVVVADMDNMLRRLIGEDIELTSVRRPGLRHIRADPDQLGQVVMNLAVNARDAMAGGGRLTIETDQATVDEDLARRRPGILPGTYVVLRVADTGCGMDSDTLSHIFEPFYTTKEPGKGTGLGLSTVYGIVKQSGGYIWVESEVGLGSTFTIYLPRVEAPAEVPAGARPGSVAGGSETVLVVEDEEAVRRLLLWVLQRNGYRVLEAPDGLSALRLAEQHLASVDLLITDVVMPEMSGRVLAEQLGRMRSDLPVLFISGYTEDAVQGVLTPGASFLEKPFSPDRLAQTVRKILDARYGRPSVPAC